MNYSLHQKFTEYGLVDVLTICPTIQVSLKYASTDNFMGINMYGKLDKAYVVPEIAEMLKKAQFLLQSIHPGFSLLIYDAARPLSIQQKMFNYVKGTPQEKYIANPGINGGGYHNYGIAVDLTIIDKNSQPLDMGSEFDCFNEISNVGNEYLLVQKNLISLEAVHNRTLLKTTMERVGFEQNPDEWWHFQKYSKEELQKRYKLLSF